MNFKKTLFDNKTSSLYIALISKSDNPVSFYDFFPISLYNCIYKIISKTISRRLKEIVSFQISPEQFGFL
jgi:hypothetical protein